MSLQLMGPGLLETASKHALANLAANKTNHVNPLGNRSRGSGHL